MGNGHCEPWSAWATDKPRDLPMNVGLAHNAFTFGLRGARVPIYLCLIIARLFTFRLLTDGVL